MLLRQLPDLQFLLVCEAVVVAEVPVATGSSTRLHNQLLSQLLDLHLHLLHLLDIWTIVIPVLILYHLLLSLSSLPVFLVAQCALLVAACSIEAIGGQDLVLEARLLLLRQRLAQDDVVVGAAGDLDRRSLVVGCYLNGHVREGKYTRIVRSGSLAHVLRGRLRIAQQSFPKLALQVGAPSIELVLVRKHKAMLESAVDFRDRLDWVLG